MKKYYVLKGKNNYFLLDKREFSKIEEYKEKYPSYILKGFYNKEEALEYANSEFYGRNFYIVKVGRNPGIYTSREDVIREVSNYPNALVMNAKTMEKAEELFKLDIEKFKILKEEKNKGEKTSSKKNKDFVKINETEILKKRKQIIKEMKNKLSNSNYVAFIDCEANNQFAISIGLVIYSLIEEKIVDTYYSLVKPNNFSKMDEYIQRMTNITNDMVLNAPEIGFVINQIEKFLNKYNIQYIFSCGKLDKSFLQKHQSFCEEVNKLTTKIENIQDIISLYFTFGIEKKRALGLQTFKTFFGLDDKYVSHNALEDAIDLTNVVHCWLQETKKIA